MKCNPEKGAKSSSLVVSGGIGCDTQEKTTGDFWTPRLLSSAKTVSELVMGICPKKHPN